MTCPPRRRRAAWLIAGAALLLATEGLARLLLPAPLTWRQPQLRFHADPELIFALVPGQRAFSADQPVHINGRGLRGAAVPPRRRRAALRLLILGDSVAFGFGVADAEVLSARTAALLAEAGVEAEVINAAVPCYNLTQTVAFLDRECERYAPDWVAAVVSWNDFSDKTGVRVSADGRLISAGQSPSAIGWTDTPAAYAVRNALKASRLLYAVRRSFTAPPPAETRRRRDVLAGRADAEIERGWQRVDEAAAAFARLAARCRFQPVLVALPFRSLLDGRHPRSSYPARVQAIAQTHRLPIIDLEPAFRRAGAVRGPLFLPYDEDHPNAAGHLVAANALAGFVLRHAGDGPLTANATALEIATHARR